MADITNLSNFLGDIADAIRTKTGKEELIAAETFDEEILDIETGIDTSDATATAAEIKSGKTAYVKGEKITGSLTYTSSTANPITAGTAAEVSYDNEEIIVDRTYGGPLLLGEGQYLRSTITNSKVSELGGITPEKIMKGNTVFGVEGTAEGGTPINNQDKTITVNGVYTADDGYTGLGTVTVNVESGGGSTEVPVKLFNSVDDMNNDPDPKDDDLALVYYNSVKNTDKSSVLTVVSFPETVVLDEAVTATSNCRFCDDEREYEYMFYLNASQFYLRDYMTYSLIARYTSTDGVTYTRTTTAESYTFEVPVAYYSGTWNDNLGEFVQTEGKIFDGLYQYAEDYIFEDELTLPKLTDISFSVSSNAITGATLTQSTDIPIIHLPKLYKVISKYFLDNELGNSSVNIYIDNDDKVRFIDDNSLYRFNSLVFNTSAVFQGIRYGTDTATAIGDNKRVNIGTFDLDNCTWEIDHTMYSGDSNIKYTYTNTKKYMMLPNSLLNMKTPYVVCTSTAVSSDGSLYIYLCSTSSNSLSTSAASVTFSLYAQRSCYLNAPSQLTLTDPNQLLPGQIAYGKAGIIEGDGSIYHSIPARIYLDGIYGDTNLSNAIYANRTATKTSYVSIKTAEDRAGLTARNAVVYAVSDAIPKVTGYSLYAATKNYLVYVSSDNLMLSVYDFTTKTKLYDITVTDTIANMNNQYTRWCKDVGNNAYLVISAYSGTKHYFISLNKTSGTITNITSYANDYIGACYMLDDRCYIVTTDATNLKMYVRKINYSDGIITTLNTSSLTNLQYAYGTDGNSDADDAYVYLAMVRWNNDYSYLLVINRETEAVTRKQYNYRITLGRHAEDNRLLLLVGDTIYNLSGTTTTSIGSVVNANADMHYLHTLYAPEAGTFSIDCNNSILQYCTFDKTTGRAIESELETIFGETHPVSLFRVIGITFDNGKMICEAVGRTSVGDVDYYTNITIDTTRQYSTEILPENRLLDLGDEFVNYAYFQNIPSGGGTVDYTGTISPAEYEEINDIAEEVLGGTE